MRWCYEIAERLGMTVAELRRTMSAQELHGWMALEKIRMAEREKAAKDAKRGRL